MIRAAILGAARLLFLTAVAIAGLALVACYCSFRLVKAATKGRTPMPVRDAGFAAMLAMVAVAQAVKAQAKESHATHE